ncbi:hypothetical protein OGAPHI_001684 [Ogataea philodendri]|uniref:Uncharacterized protein n=1 Tax=Ogataea philodendri TaxID=1378263 RepID=A0A9P8PBC9_9ASCO|nr:uncharacterized protein OGAPHI_001684 [Ogataea philodendri]KAH3669088.1 hypothetical protein OGAPHI_001684 [Ogataea philodendri]
MEIRTLLNESWGFSTTEPTKSCGSSSRFFLPFCAESSFLMILFAFWDSSRGTEVDGASKSVLETGLFLISTGSVETPGGAAPLAAVEPLDTEAPFASFLTAGFFVSAPEPVDDADWTRLAHSSLFFTCSGSFAATEDSSCCNLYKESVTEFPSSSSPKTPISSSPAAVVTKSRRPSMLQQMSWIALVLISLAMINGALDAVFQMASVLSVEAVAST